MRWSGRRRAATIPLADGDADPLGATTRRPAARGRTVVTAADGQHAIDRCASERPDLVPLDVGMPRVNGFEACRRIRETAARSDDDNVVQVFPPRADDYVSG